MKRLQIMIDEDLDSDLERYAAESGRSKASLIREAVRARFHPLPSPETDPLFKMVGADDFEPAGIDETVYR